MKLWFCVGIFIEITMLYFAYMQRGYFAVGGEVLFIPFIVIIKSIYEHDKQKYGNGFYSLNGKNNKQ